MYYLHNYLRSHSSYALLSLCQKKFTGHGLLAGRVIGFDGPKYRVCYEEVISEADLHNFELTHIPRPELKRRREESVDDEKPKSKKKSTKKAKQANATRKQKEK